MRPSQARSVRIGGLYILSGPLSRYGQQGACGTRLAVEELNAEGGLLARPVELLLEDTKADPAWGVRAAQRLIEEQRVDFLVGITNSEVALAVSELALQHETPLVVVDAATHRLTGSLRHPYVFRTITNSLMEGRAHARIFADQPWKRWFVIGPDYEYGYAFATAFWEELKRLRPDVELTGKAFPALGSTDFSSTIRQVQRTEVDAVYNSLWGQDLVQFIQQALSSGLLKGCQHVCARGSLQMNIALGENPPEGMWVGTPYFFIYPPTRRNHAFVERYKARFDHYPDYISHEAYAGVLLLKHAVERAGSLKADRVIEAAEGLQFESPKGTKFVQPTTHQVVEDIIVGRLLSRCDYPFPILTDLVISPAEENYIPIEEAEHFLDSVRGL